MVRRAVVVCMVLLLLAGCAKGAEGDVAGVYVTGDFANPFSSYMPSLELREDGTFVINAGVKSEISGTFEVKDNGVVLAIEQNSTKLKDAPTIALRIEDHSTLILSAAIPDSTKASAVFTKLEEQ